LRVDDVVRGWVALRVGVLDVDRQKAEILPREAVEGDIQGLSDGGASAASTYYKFRCEGPLRFFLGSASASLGCPPSYLIEPVEASASTCTTSPSSCRPTKRVPHLILN
jgi:hypothetical protein